MRLFLNFIWACMICTQSLFSQNPLSQQVQTEFGFGISLPILHSGTELLRSQDIRSNEMSYFADAQGNRRNVGSYGSLIGWSASIAYYHPTDLISGMMLGATFRTSLTGSQPAEGGYEEGYFFNFLSVGAAAKYYPFTQNELFLKTDVGLASVFTKNRFLDSQSQQLFLHQFGIGLNLSVTAGYSLQAFNDQSKAIDLQLIYQFNSTRVEVNEIGNDMWSYSALTLLAAFNF